MIWYKKISMGNLGCSKELCSKGCVAAFPMALAVAFPPFHWSSSEWSSWKLLFRWQFYGKSIWHPQSYECALNGLCSTHCVWGWSGSGGAVLHNCGFWQNRVFTTLCVCLLVVKCMCMVGDKWFFLGSRLADSLLVQYTAGNASAGTPGFNYKPGKEEVGIVSNLCYHRYQREPGYYIGWILLMANLIKESKCSLEIFCTASFVLQTL